MQKQQTLVLQLLFLMLILTTACGSKNKLTTDADNLCNVFKAVQNKEFQKNNELLELQKKAADATPEYLPTLVAMYIDKNFSTKLKTIYAKINYAASGDEYNVFKNALKDEGVQWNCPAFDEFFKNTNGVQ